MQPPPTPHIPRRRRVSAAWHAHAQGRHLIFLHIPKTAGTAITSFLRSQVSASEFMPQLLTAAHRSHPIWPFIARRHTVLGVGMHLDYDQLAALRAGLPSHTPPFLFTVLREPKARILSQYKEWRFTSDEAMEAAEAHLQEAILTARTQPFSAFLRSENPNILHILKNLQARLLVGRSASRHLSDADLLKHARRHLAEFDLVGTTSACDETVAALADAYGWPIPRGGAPLRHVSQQPPAEMLQTTAADEALIAELNAVDLALWQDLLHDRLPATADRTEQPDTHSKSATSWWTDRLASDGSPIPVPPTLDLSPAAIAARHAAVCPLDGEPESHAAWIKRLYRQVAEVVDHHAATRVIDLDRRARYPMPADDPAAVAADERAALIVRLPALQYWPRSILHQAAGAPQSLLVITEVDDGDPRLLALLQQPAVRPFVRLAGDARAAVLAVALGELCAAHGVEKLDALLDTLQRCLTTHPSAVKAFHDSPSARALAAVVLHGCLEALTHIAEQTTATTSGEPDAWAAALFTTLVPEAHDPLLSLERSPDSLASLADRILALRDPLLACLPPRAQPHLRFATDILSSSPAIREPATTVTSGQFVDAYDAVFRLLCQLTTRPPLVPMDRAAGQPWEFDVTGPLLISNVHALEGTGPEAFRWLGPERHSHLLIPVRADQAQQLDLFLVAFADPDLFPGITYEINGTSVEATYGVADNCTVATFAITADQATGGTIALKITAPFTTSDADRGLGADTRQKSMALRRIRVLS